MSNWTPSTIHERATVHETVRFGENCTVWQYATICEETVLEECVVVGSAAWVGRQCLIGANTRIQHGAFIPNRTNIGCNVFIGPNATLTDDRYPKVNAGYEPNPPILLDNCSIGAGAVILPGVRIGHGATVGAGAVVSQDVPPFTTVVGVPARPVPLK